MNIAIYHPQIMNFGGGEAMSLSLASHLSRRHKVTVFSPYQVDKPELGRFFDVDLTHVDFFSPMIWKLLKKIPDMRSYKSSFYARCIGMLNKHDLVIDTGTNGFFSKELRPKTICYIHFPSFPTPKKGWKAITNPLLIHSESALQYDALLCNSRFTREHVRRHTDKEMEVVYPPVRIRGIRQETKKKLIVTIGRFSCEKKHEVMIKAFKELLTFHPGWEFHLIGSFQNEIDLYDPSYLQLLQRNAKGLPIQFHLNMPHDEVLKFLAGAGIYWHARGFGEKDPHTYENFGMATVEAMAGGSVPVVINLGAQPEIVDHKQNGYCWNDLQELVKYTREIIKSREKRKEFAKKAKEKARMYDEEKCYTKFKRIISSMVFSIY